MLHAHTIFRWEEYSFNWSKCHTKFSYYVSRISFCLAVLSKKINDCFNYKSIWFLKNSIKTNYRNPISLIDSNVINKALLLNKRKYKSLFHIMITDFAFYDFYYIKYLINMNILYENEKEKKLKQIN